MAAYKESGGPIDISTWKEMFAQRNVIEIELEKELNEIKDSIVITKLRNEHEMSMDVYSDVKKCYQASYGREDNWNVFEKKEVYIDVRKVNMNLMNMHQKEILFYKDISISIWEKN